MHKQKICQMRVRKPVSQSRRRDSIYFFIEIHFALELGNGNQY